MRGKAFWLMPAALVASPIAGPDDAWAATYLTVSEAQKALLPGEHLTPLSVELTKQQAGAIEKRAGVRVRSRSLQVWKGSGGSHFFVDRVIGKHEFITYALALGPGGEVRGIEVLDYRETYGDEIGREAWRRQFLGKRAGDPLKLGLEVKNISGATLSCRHLTDGVRRLLATYETALR